MSKMSNNEPLCTHEEAIQIALSKINQGCCLQYVSDGLREWLGVETTPEELDAELSDHPDLLPSYQRLKNAWYNIRHVEPDDTNPFLIQQKYGFDWRYQEYILEPYEDDEQAAEPAQTDEVRAVSEKIIEQNREAYDLLASADKERSE